MQCYHVNTHQTYFSKWTEIHKEASEALRYICLGSIKVNCDVNNACQEQNAWLWSLVPHSLMYYFLYNRHSIILDGAVLQFGVNLSFIYSQVRWQITVIFTSIKWDTMHCWTVSRKGCTCHGHYFFILLWEFLGHYSAYIFKSQNSDTQIKWQWVHIVSYIVNREWFSTQLGLFSRGKTTKIKFPCIHQPQLISFKGCLYERGAHISFLDTHTHGQIFCDVGFLVLLLCLLSNV